MFHGKVLAFSALAIALLSSSSMGPAQIGVSIGVEPGCPYGYFDYAPYDCAPYGYYGPSWFSSGVFIGAGPWYHGWGHPVYPRPYARGFVGRGFDGRGRVVGHGFVARGPVGGSRGGFHGGGFRGGR